MNETFLKQLRDALNHIYDPENLRGNPLIYALGVSGKQDVFTHFQKLLIDAIQTLKPVPGEPSHSRRKRIYDLLHYRYIEQFGQSEVAEQLGISTRHMRREQQSAIEALAGYLWDDYALDEKYPKQSNEQTVKKKSHPLQAEDEIDLLVNHAINSPSQFSSVLDGVIDLFDPYTKVKNVRIEQTIEEDLPLISVSAEVLRQLLINIIDLSILFCSNGVVSITTETDGNFLEILFTCHSSAPMEGPRLAIDHEKVSIIEQLAEQCNSNFSIQQVFPLRLILAVPILEQITVLVIDDNQDIFQLFHRYLSGTQYRTIFSKDPSLGLEAALKNQPQIIITDVMMPRVDGWELLGRFRQHPATSHIPIIVCTVLPQEDLSYSLGAAGYIRKPVTREEFLDTIERVTRLLGLADGSMRQNS